MPSASPLAMAMPGQRTAKDEDTENKVYLLKGFVWNANERTDVAFAFIVTYAPTRKFILFVCLSVTPQASRHMII